MSEYVNVRISKQTHELLKEVKRKLKRMGRGGREASYTRIIEEALREYMKKLEEE